MMRERTVFKLLALALVVGAALSASGCGRKGDLDAPAPSLTQQ